MLETVARSDDGARITHLRRKAEAGFAADPAHEMFGSAETNSRSRGSTTADLVLRTRRQIKQLRFDSVNADFSVANVLLNLLRTKNVHEASDLRFGCGGALGAAR
jgi:hypothetical protein